MDLLQVLIPAGGTIVGGALLWVLAASLPDSAAWIVGRWFDLWAWLRTNSCAVREALGDVEADFWDRYEAERAGGSGTTRATCRALWFVRWEVARAPAIAEAVDELDATGNSRRRVLTHGLIVRIKLLVLISQRITIGPVMLLMALAVVAPAIGLHVVKIIDAAQDQSINYAILTIRFLAAIALSWTALKIVVAFRLRGSFTSKLYRCHPVLSIALIASYIIFWLSILFLGIEGRLLASVGISLVSLSYLGMTCSLTLIIASLLLVERQRLWLASLMDEVADIEHQIKERFPRLLTTAGDRIEALRSEIDRQKKALDKYP